MTTPPSRAGSANVERPALQPGDGGSRPTPAHHFWIRPADYHTAKAFIERWHYSGCIPKGKNICYGLYAGEALYAIIVYGIGVNPYQARFLGVKTVLEIKRMCRSEPPLAGFPLSRFIAVTLRFIRKEHNPECIVAFADPEQGHEGTVYSAAGFARHGTTNAEWHVMDKDGKKRHRRFAFRYSRRNDCTIAEARERLDLTRVQTQPKIRWVKYLVRVTP